MSGGCIAAISATVNAASFSGSLSKSAAPSGNIVTSDAVTVYIPAGHDGLLNETSYSSVGTVNYQVDRNAAGLWTAVSVSSFTWANGDTLQARITSAVAGESYTFSIIETRTGKVIAGPFTVAAV